MSLRRKESKWDGPHDCAGDLCRCKQLGGKRVVKNDPKSRRDRSKSQEDRIAADLRKVGFPDAKRVFGSGAIPGLPADINPGELYLAEAKETRASKSNPGGRLTIDPEWVLKIRQQSRDMGRKGWFALHAWCATDNSNYYKTVLLPEEFFYELLRVYMKQEEQLGLFDGSVSEVQRSDDV